MGIYAGFTELGDTLVIMHLVKTADGIPVNADSLPTYRVYGPAGLLPLATGSLALADHGAITGATNATPIVITSAGHGLSTGTRVTISGVVGNTNANGTFVVTYLSSSTFSLVGTSGSGAWTSGGAWNVTGLYSITLAVTAQNGYDVGETYTVLVFATYNDDGFADLNTFSAV